MAQQGDPTLGPELWNEQPWTLTRIGHLLWRTCVTARPHIAQLATWYLTDRLDGGGQPEQPRPFNYFVEIYIRKIVRPILQAPERNTDGDEFDFLRALLQAPPDEWSEMREYLFEYLWTELSDTEIVAFRRIEPELAGRIWQAVKGMYPGSAK